MTKTTTEPTYKERILKAACHITDAVAILHDLQTDWEEAKERRDAAGQAPISPYDDPMDESIDTLTDWVIEAERLEGHIAAELADTFAAIPVPGFVDGRWLRRED